MTLPSFNIGLIDQFVRDQGQLVSWYSSIQCPNHRTDTGDPLQICSQCSGYGIIWKSPVSVQGFITSVDQRSNYDIPGWWAKGECVFSPPTSIKPSRYDKIVLQQLIENTEVRTRGDDDHISFMPNKIWEVIDTDNVQYSASDFTISEGSKIKGQRSIIWADDKGPAFGTRYSLKYDFKPEWLVFDIPLIRFANNVDLGRRVLLRRWDIAWVAA